MPIRRWLSRTVLAALAITLAATPLSLTRTANAADPTNEVVILDIRPFLASKTSDKTRYDYLKLLTAMQGIVNRDKPQLFLIGPESDRAQAKPDFQPDEFWLDKITKPGQILAGTPQVKTTDVNAVIDRFIGNFTGVVVWDQNVPATANLAATAAGVENLLPVRFDDNPNSPYQDLVTRRHLQVGLDLVGKFTGTGTIPDTTISSTKSAKNDAYRWAMARWVDTGKVNTHLMAYALDGVSWSIINKAPSLVRSEIPDTIEAGTTAQIKLTYKNTSTRTWTMAANDRLGAQAGNGFTWTDLNGGYANGTSARVFMDPTASIAPGQEYTFTFSIKAPTTGGNVGFAAAMVRDGVAWYGGTNIQKDIQVLVNGQPVEPKPDNSVKYPDMFNAFLLNADYYIGNKAFFFDLSPDETTVPNDDPKQPLGTDYSTLIDLLRKSNKNAKDSIITIGGFVPWWLKYTTTADPNAKFDPVPMEWKYADIISGYFAQKDADAYSLSGLSNASVYQKVQLPTQFKQKNDKGASAKPYDAKRKYITFYMGDYDSAAWTAGTMPVYWDDPARGKIPLAWAPNPSLSARVPQVFNYLYETQTANDYFVAGDNGAGYLNPMKLAQRNRPDGLPDRLDAWAAYNKEYFTKFDLDITGFLISGNSGTVPKDVQQAYAKFSPEGVGTNNGFDQPVVDGTPWMTVAGFPRDISSAEKYGEALATQLRRDQQFTFVREVLVPPTVLAGAVDYVKQKYPELDFEVLDPYTMFDHYAEAKPWLTPAATYKADFATQTPKVDGTVSAGEWDNAQIATLSPSSDIVKKAGKVWPTITDDNDLSSNFRIRWDEKNIYLLEERTDDKVDFSTENGNLFTTDSMMLSLDLGNNRSGSAYRLGDYGVIVSPGSPGDPTKPRVVLREGQEETQSERVVKTVSVASTQTATGYTMEVAIPWSELQGMPFDPMKADQIGFTLLAVDNDGAGNRGQIQWVGDGDNQAYWAGLQFTNKPAPKVTIQGLSNPYKPGRLVNLHVCIPSGANCPPLPAGSKVQWEQRMPKKAWQPAGTGPAYQTRAVPPKNGLMVRATVTFPDGKQAKTQEVTIQVKP